MPATHMERQRRREEPRLRAAAGRLLGVAIVAAALACDGPEFCPRPVEARCVGTQRQFCANELFEGYVWKDDGPDCALGGQVCLLCPDPIVGSSALCVTAPPDPRRSCPAVN